MPRFVIVMLAAALLVLGAPSHAQTAKGANGGLVAKSQGHPIELVVSGQDLVFYIGDHDGAPVSTTGMKGRATIQDGDKTVQVELQPATPNKLVGKLAAPLGAKAKIAFTASTHGHGLTARYVTD